jgi:hypothetical protein
LNNLLDEVREYYRSLESCCLPAEAGPILNKAVGAIAFIQSEPDGADGCAILVTLDGFYTLVEGQDYTGHG